MRKHFQEYLGKNLTDESLKFWEYAEDYRRGHPQSSYPFDLGSTEVPSQTKGRNSKSMLKGSTSNNNLSGCGSTTAKDLSTIQNVIASAEETSLDEGNKKPLSAEEKNRIETWCKTIYECFIEDGAPMQIGDCSSDSKEMIIANMKDCHPNLFLDIQLKIFHNLKFKIYPDFVSKNGYRKVLQSVLLNKETIVS
jgi:hypothetical protein